MNYLALCQKLVRKAGIPGVGPTTVVNQTGELLRVIEWVKDAWSEIQTKHTQWTFRWVYAQTQALALNGRIFDPTVDWAINVSRFDTDTFKLNHTALGLTDQRYVSFEPWQSFESRFVIGPVQSGFPSVFSVRPDGKVMFNTQLDDAYTAVFDYYRGTQFLAADADIPYLPVDHHDAIWQKALMLYAEFEEAGSLYATAKRDYKSLQNAMERLYLPELVWGEPLA